MGTEEGEQVADFAPQGFFGTFGGFTEQVFEFGKDLLDPLAGRRLHAIAVRRVQVGAVGRQEPKPCARRPNSLADSGSLLAAEVVQMRRIRK